MQLPSRNRNSLDVYLLSVFEIGLLTFKAKKFLCFTHPLFNATAREEPVRISDETYPAKTRMMGATVYGENFIILTSTVFSRPLRTNGRA